ncbi:MAG: hypothetical protein ACOCV8_03955, partial [Spirochaetota bacterium]
ARETAKRGNIEKALNIAEKIESDYWKSEAMRDIAREIAERGDSEKANIVLQKALNIAEKIEDDYWKSEAMRDVARETAKRGNIEKALNIAELILIIISVINCKIISYFSEEIKPDAENYIEKKLNELDINKENREVIDKYFEEMKINTSVKNAYKRIKILYSSDKNKLKEAIAELNNNIDKLSLLNLIAKTNSNENFIYECFKEAVATLQEIDINKENAAIVENIGETIIKNSINNFDKLSLLKKIYDLTGNQSPKLCEIIGKFLITERIRVWMKTLYEEGKKYRERKESASRNSHGTASNIIFNITNENFNITKDLNIEIELSNETIIIKIISEKNEKEYNDRKLIIYKDSDELRRIPINNGKINIPLNELGFNVEENNDEDIKELLSHLHFDII